MQALIDFVIRNLLALWPIARVYSWQQGLRVRRGVIREELAPGLHWRWWFVDEVRTWATTTIGLDLATASITTTDGTAVSLSANVAYRMISIRQMWSTVWNAEQTLGLVALGEIATRCAQRSWTELRANRAALEADLVLGLNTRVATWGMCVERVHLTDLVVTRGHRHYLDGMGKAS